MQKHTVIRFGNMFIGLGLGIPIVVFLMFLSADDEPGRYVAWPICAVWLVIMCIHLGKIILLSFSRIIIDESGLTAIVPFRKKVTMKWEDVTRLGFRYFEAGGLYDQQWLCFISKNNNFPIKFKQLPMIPYPSENCIYMVYSEFVWEMIRKHLKGKVYSDAMTKSREIV